MAQFFLCSAGTERSGPPRADTDARCGEVPRHEKDGEREEDAGPGRRDACGENVRRGRSRRDRVKQAFAHADGGAE